jgi:hypothetical protein
LGTALHIDLGPHFEARWKHAPLRVRREIMAELYEIYRFLEDDDTPMLASTPAASRPAPPRPAPVGGPAGKAAAPSAQAQTSLFEPPPATGKPAPDLTPRADNPFLPKSVLNKLQDSQAKASAQLRQLMHTHDNPLAPDVHRMEQDLRLKLGPVIESLIEEHMQGLKAELRFRLRAEMERLIATAIKKEE